MADISAMMPLTCSIACAASATADWIAPTWPAISSVALAVWPASDFTSEATTAKPLPGLARARRLDGGVEREQVGLSGDRLDEADHLADAGRGVRRAPTSVRTVRCASVTARLGDLGRADGLLGDARRSRRPAPRPSLPPR